MSDSIICKREVKPRDPKSQGDKCRWVGDGECQIDGLHTGELLHSPEVRVAVLTSLTPKSASELIVYNMD